jgi:hypothetical protein
MARPGKRAASIASAASASRHPQALSPIERSKKEKHMQTHTNKEQPLTLDSLLEMRRKLKARLRVKRGVSVMDADWLQELYQRCNDAIARALIDQSINLLHSDSK